MGEDPLDHCWSSRYERGRDYVLVTAQSLSKLLNLVDPDASKTCLDIGCGTGQLSRELYHREYLVDGIDASTKAIELAKSAAPFSSDRLAYLRFDIERDSLAQLPRQQYGLITCKLMYAFIKDKPRLLTNVNHLLEPEGAFVVISPTVEQVPPEKINIAVDQGDIDLLAEAFKQIELYEDHGLTVFVGRKLPSV